MAEVYLARRDGDLVDRDLVVKRMLPHLAEDTRFVQLFLREARIAARLSHPNVVQVLDVGQEGDEYFIAMEYLDGLTVLQLARRLWASGRALPLPVVAQLVCDAALGLHHAHIQLTDDGRPGNLVHRDVSPDNLLVTRTGSTKVLDFGIAAGAFVGRVTRTGEIKGKVRYMSPEQIAGDDLDARTDVFALGVTLYWLLTGRHAFTGKNELALMKAVVESEPPPPSVVNPQVPKELDALVARMMAKARMDRMSSAEAVYEALAPFAGAAGQRRTAEVVAEALELPDPAQPTNLEPEAETTPAGQPATVQSGSGAFASAGDDDLPAVGTGSFELVDGQETAAPPVATTAEDPHEAPTRSGVALVEATVREALRPALVEATLADEADAVLPRRRVGRAAVLAGTLAGGALVVGAIAIAVAPRDDAESLVATDPSATVDAGPSAALSTDAGPQAVAVPPPLPDPAPRATDDGRATERERRVVARAPAHVRWTTMRGQALGRGDCTFRVPVGTGRVVATDGQLGGRVVVPVADTIDWARLPRGELSFIVLPWADVTLGKKVLGRTPRAGPLRVVAGTYEVLLTSGAKSRKVSVEVPPGGAAVVRETFLE